MRAGKLRHRISIERRPVEYDNRGHETGSWKVIQRGLYCTVVELSGRELERARQIVAEVTIQITTRRSSAKSTDRIRFGERIFEVMAVTTNEIGTEQTIFCVELR